MITTYGPGRRNCRFDVVEIAALDEWPHALYPAHLLLCLDARTVSPKALAALAGRLVRGGLGSALCAGPDRGRVHDAFHEAGIEIDEVRDRFADTLFAFALFAPPEPFELPAVRTVVLIDQADRARHVHRWLAAFCARR
jgi:hypothetical protein